MPETWAAFVFDAERCTACEACRIACGIENNGGRDTGWRQVLTLNPRRHPRLPTRHLSIACNHCDTPACMLGCPAAAYRRDHVTGAILLDQARCLGCRYCSWVCPYDAPRFDETLGVMTKCHFCAERLAAGSEPACTLACPTGALAFGVRRETDGEPLGPGLTFTGLGPALQTLPARRSDPPETLPIPPMTTGAVLQPAPPVKVRGFSEWTLVVFTLAVPFLVAWFGAGVVRAERVPTPLPFLALGVVALALSALHLGRPGRAWRAALNLPGSWLSREIVLTSAFLVLAGAQLMFPGWLDGVATGWITLLLGGAALLAIDLVYEVIPGAGQWRLHSAGTLLTGVFFLALAADLTTIALLVGAIKAALLARRVLRVGFAGPPALVAARVAFLLGACIPVVTWWVALTLALAGEALDRLAFYDALDPASPARTMVEHASRT